MTWPDSACRIARSGGPAPAPTTLSASLTDGAFALSCSTVTGAAECEMGYRKGGSSSDRESMGATTAAAGVLCSTTCELAARSYGDRSDYAADRGQYATTAACVMSSDCSANPVFGASTYTFSVAEDVAAGALRGHGLATEPEDDILSYSIMEGNGQMKFAIDGSSGAVTVASSLDHETATSYILTVQADDCHGGTATLQVQASPTW